ncbi:unnamed protein product, partial [Linum tenue]
MTQFANFQSTYYFQSTTNSSIKRISSNLNKYNVPASEKGKSRTDTTVLRRVGCLITLQNCSFLCQSNF